jgi:ABC-type molybdate transport system permease subunit
MVKVPSLVALTVLDFVHSVGFGCVILIVGAVLSTTNTPLVLVVIFVFHAPSDIDHDNTHK